MSSVRTADPKRHLSLSDGNSQMRAVGTIIENVADTDATVVIRGESSVGKDLVARRIHTSSSRRAGPFVKVNCAAIPSKPIESEFFGHEKGFAGAHRRKPGQLEYAHEGTIYLDEIGELPLALQAKLLQREIEALVTRGRNGSVRVQHSTESLREIARRAAARDVERQALEDVLHRVDWNRAAASRILRVNYKTLLHNIVECGLTPPHRQSAKPQAGGASR